MTGVCQRDTAANWRTLNGQAGTISATTKNKAVMDYNPKYKNKSLSSTI